MLPILVGAVDKREASYPSAPHFLSKIPIATTVARMLKLNGIKLSIGNDKDLARVVSSVANLLGNRAERMGRLRRQRASLVQRSDAARLEKDSHYNRIKAIVEGKNVAGEGASSVVYQGVIDGVPVAIKALKTASASAQRKAELVAQFNLEVRPSSFFVKLKVATFIAALLYSTTGGPAQPRGAALFC